MEAVEGCVSGLGAIQKRFSTSALAPPDHDNNVNEGLRRVLAIPTANLCFSAEADLKLEAMALEPSNQPF